MFLFGDLAILQILEIARKNITPYLVEIRGAPPDTHFFAIPVTVATVMAII